MAPYRYGPTLRCLLRLAVAGRPQPAALHAGCPGDRRVSEGPAAQWLPPGALAVSPRGKHVLLRPKQRARGHD